MVFRSLPKIILKEKGQIIELEQYITEKYPYIKRFIKILEEELNFLYKDEHLDIELNLVEYGNIGNELLLDNRLKTNILKELVKELNDYGGLALYHSGVYGDILLEQYIDEKICYIGLQQVPIFNMLRLVFHELYHFLDPIPLREWQEHLGKDLIYIHFNETIKASVRVGLNEYFANLYSYIRVLELMNNLKKEYDNSSIDYFFECIMATSKKYLSNLDIILIEFIDSLKGENLNNSNIQAKIIQFFCFKFYSKIYYFLGAWKAYKKVNINSDILQEVWDQFLEKIGTAKLKETCEFLEEFKCKVLEGFKYRNINIIVRYVELLFLEFFRKKLLFEIYSFI